MTLSIFAIVEGHGERDAVPLLLRRLAHECFSRFDVNVLPPMRLTRGKILNPYHLKRAVELGRRRIHEYGPNGGIMILFDADDDCPKERSEQVLAAIGAGDLDVRVSVVMPKREYEAWFLAAALSLRGRRNVSSTAEPPDDPEEIRGAKEYFMKRILVPNAAYSETADQAAYTARMNFKDVMACRSFRKLHHACEVLFRRDTARETS